MFRTGGFVFRKTVVYVGNVWFVYMHRYELSCRQKSAFAEDEPSGSKHVEDIKKIKNKIINL